MVVGRYRKLTAASAEDAAFQGHLASAIKAIEQAHNLCTGRHATREGRQRARGQMRKFTSVLNTLRQMGPLKGTASTDPDLVPESVSVERQRVRLEKIAAARNSMGER